MKGVVLFLLLLTRIYAVCFAQTGLRVPGADHGAGIYILNVSGIGYTISDNEKSVFISARSSGGNGVLLEEGSFINIESNTIMELKVRPANIILQVSELSSFRILEAEKRSCTIEISYGRIGVKSGSSSTGFTFRITGPNTTITAESGDFGYDFTYSTDKEILNQVYCFNGNISVAENRGNNTYGRVIKLQANEKVNIVDFMKNTVITKEKIDSSIIAFWSGQAFKEASLMANMMPTEEKENTGQDIPVEKTEEATGPVHTETGTGESSPEENLSSSGTDETGENKEEIKSEETPMNHFVLDLGLEITFLLLPPSEQSQTSIPGLDFLINILRFLQQLKGGLVLDFAVMFNPVIGLGVETGFLYNNMDVNSVNFHFFSIPAFLIVRFNLGPVFTQLYGGIEVVGSSDGSFQDLSYQVMYDAGLKLGFHLGGSTFYALGGMYFQDFSNFSFSTVSWKFGLGIKFNLLGF